MGDGYICEDAMTDDLMKRLRDKVEASKIYDDDEELLDEAADRITQLENALKEILSLGEWGANMLARTVAMEALETKYDRLNGKEGA